MNVKTKPFIATVRRPKNLRSIFAAMLGKL